MDRQTILWIVIPATLLLVLVPAFRVFSSDARRAWQTEFSASKPGSWSTGQKCTLVGFLGAVGATMFGGLTGLDIWAGGVGIVCSTIIGADKKKRDAEKKLTADANPWVQRAEENPPVQRGDLGGSPP